MAPADEAITEVDRLIRRASDEHLISATGGVLVRKELQCEKMPDRSPKMTQREAFLKAGSQLACPINFAVTNFVVALSIRCDKISPAL